MSKKTWNMAVGFSALAILCISSLALAAEFSADIVMAGTQKSSVAKLYRKGTEVRREGTFGPHKTSMIMIIRPDKHVTWLLQPSTKTYFEIPGVQPTPHAADYAKAAKTSSHVKLIGKTTMNGYTCEEYRITAPRRTGQQAGRSEQTIWISTKLDEVLKTQMKMSSTHGTMVQVMELKNISERKLPDSLFDIPEGYKKRQMPSMSQNHMHGGMPPNPHK